MNSTSALLASTHAVLPESICMALLYRREVAPDPDPSRMEERRFHPATPSLPPRERVLRAGETTPSCSTTRPGRRCTWSPSDRVRAVVAGSAPTVAVAALERVGEGHEVVVRLPLATAARAAPLLEHVRDRHVVHVRLRPHTPRRQWLRHPGLGLRRWRLGSRRRWRRWRGAPPRGSGRGGRGGVPRWARGRWLRASSTAAGIAGKLGGERLQHGRDEGRTNGDLAVPSIRAGEARQAASHLPLVQPARDQRR